MAVPDNQAVAADGSQNGSGVAGGNTPEAFHGGQAGIQRSPSAGLAGRENPCGNFVPVQQCILPLNCFRTEAGMGAGIKIMLAVDAGKIRLRL